MGFIDDLKQSVKQVADFAEKKTDTVVEISKLKYQQIQTSKNLDDLMAQLGSAVYSMVKSDYDNKNLVDSLIAEIDTVKENLAEIEEKLAERRDLILCSQCGAKNEKDSIFCKRCGSKLNRTAAEEVTEPMETDSEGSKDQQDEQNQE